jgi:hypothetical protein
MVAGRQLAESTANRQEMCIVFVWKIKLIAALQSMNVFLKRDTVDHFVIFHYVWEDTISKF